MICSRVGVWSWWKNAWKCDFVTSMRAGMWWERATVRDQSYKHTQTTYLFTCSQWRRNRVGQWPTHFFNCVGLAHPLLALLSFVFVLLITTDHRLFPGLAHPLSKIVPPPLRVVDVNMPTHLTLSLCNWLSMSLKDMTESSLLIIGFPAHFCHLCIQFH